MAKKTATKTATKPPATPAPAEEPVSEEKPQEKAAATAPVAKPKEKAADDQSNNSNVGIADIKKAVTFANSVGGLDKAIALLQIVKVAKDVQ